MTPRSVVKAFSSEQKSHRNKLQLNSPHTDVQQRHLKYRMLFAQHDNPNHTMNLYLLVNVFLILHQNVNVIKIGILPVYSLLYLQHLEENT